MTKADTIFAVASGSGRAAIAIVRLSGPRTGAALSLMIGQVPRPRVATLAKLRDAEGAVLDAALVLWFPAPTSFTGEDCAELHLHGGRAVVEAVLGTLGRLPGLRMAEPGEFTRRAFINGKMDLPEVEGLADLIEAQTEAQRRQAVRQLDGALGRWASARRLDLLRALAAAEAAIDFSDEPDVAGDFEAEVLRLALGLDQDIALELDHARVAARVRDGLVVALTGPPNSGKSTLLNALARREAAIVSPHAGTTRDPVEVQLDLDGSLVICIDTAGLRDTEDPVEREGVARALARAASADLVLWLSDARAPVVPDRNLVAPAIWRIATHADLAQGAADAEFAVASPTGIGLPDLIAALRAFAGQGQAGGGAGLVTRLRHRQALERARAALAPILVGPGQAGMEVVAEHLRATSAALDALMGQVGTEEVLGEIFSRFCVGK